MDDSVMMQGEERLADWRDFMLRTLLKRRVQRDLAEDLTQDALASAWGARAQMRDPGSEHSWLRSIVLNRWRAHCMRSRTQEELVSEPEAVSSDPCRVAMRAEATQAARSVLRLLHGRQAQMLLLRHGHGVAPRDMARSMGIADGVVRHQLHAGRKTLLQALRTSRVQQAMAAVGIERVAFPD